MLSQSVQLVREGTFWNCLCRSVCQCVSVCALTYVTHSAPRIAQQVVYKIRYQQLALVSQA